MNRIVEAVRLFRQNGRLIVFTNGCFDILHPGHVRMFSQIKSDCGESSMVIVGVNSDVSVQKLKGPTRPINPQGDRAEVIAGLACVDAVVIFNDERATALLRMLKPDVWAKGGGYTIDILDNSERSAVEEYDGRILLLPMLEGRSTTSILARLY